MNPTLLQQLIDELFATLEKNDPSLAPLLAMLNGIIDEVGLPALAALLASLGISGTTSVVAFVDGLFQALEQKMVGHPFVLAALTFINEMIDAAVSKLTVTPKGFSSVK